MLFSLEALEAHHGDALLLHYDDSGAAGTEPKKKIIVIDGGPGKVWEKSLKPRLEQLRASRAHGGSLPLRMLMVSHIDDDHINGIIDLARAVRKAEEAGADPPYDFPSLWHNSFNDLVRTVGLNALDRAADGATVGTAGAGGPAPAWMTKLKSGGRAIAASVPQGRELRQLAEQLDCNLNPGFDDLVIAKPGAAGATPIGKQLRFRVIGPSQSRLDALRNDWAKKMEALRKKKTDPAEAASPVEAAAYIDPSIYNLSSIVVIAEMGGKRMLLTGDARGDDILAGLKEAGQLDAQGSAHFELLKVQHHGSKNNSEKAFFEKVVADHYVISADGTHDHPDKEMLQMLTAARGKTAYTVHLTNAVPHAVTALEEARKKNPGLKVVVRKDPALSLVVNLGEPLAD